MEMTDYKNFEHQEEDEDKYEDAEDNRETQETSFTDRQEENLLFDKDKDLVKDPKNFTRSDKRIFLEKYFKLRVYGDAESRQFLDKIEMRKDPTSDSDVEVYFNGEKVGDVDLENGTGKLDKSSVMLQAFEKAYHNIKTYRTTTLKGQIEENTGTDSDVFNGTIEDNIKQKFQYKMNKIEAKDQDKKKPGEDIELTQLKEDMNRITTGKKLETDAGKQILVDEIRVARRSLEFQKMITKRLPIISAFMVPIVAILTLVILAARGVFYKGANAVASNKKKKADAGFDPIREAQDLASDVIQKLGENVEITTAIAVAAYFVFRKQKS